MFEIDVILDKYQTLVNLSSSSSTFEIDVILDKYQTQENGMNFKQIV